MSVDAVRFRRVVLAVAVGCAVTALMGLSYNHSSSAVWASWSYPLLLPAGILAAILGPTHGPRWHWLALAINLIIYSGGTYLVLWSRQKHRSRPGRPKNVGVLEEILTQERPPIFTGLSALGSFLILGFMSVTFARWHKNLNFAALSVLPFYFTSASMAVGVNVVFGCVAIAKGEAHAGRIAVISASACIFAAFAFAVSTH